MSYLSFDHADSTVAAQQFIQQQFGDGPEEDITCRACGWAGSATETVPFDRCPNCKQDTVRDDVVYNAPPDAS